MTSRETDRLYRMNRIPPPTPNAVARDDVGRWNRIDNIIIIGLWFFAAVAARTALSWDSYRYLSSAKGLFSNDMAEWYDWIREPLYPLLLRATNEVFGGSDIWIVAMQAAIVAAGVAFFCWLWWPQSPGLRRAAMVMIIANPIVVGFVGWVGQQSLLLALMCVTAGWLALVGDSDGASTASVVVISAVLGPAIVLTSALFLPLVLVAGAYAWLAPRWSHASIRLPREATINKRTATLAATSLVLCAVIALGGWWAYKAVVIADGGNAHTDAAWIWDFGGEVDDVPSRIMPKVLAFLTLGPEEYEAVNVPEIVIYGALILSTSDRCGETFSADPPSVDYSEGFIEISCRPRWSTAVHRFLGSLGLAVYRLSMLTLFVAAMPGLLILPQVRVFAVLTVAFLLPYFIGGLGISRYALPLYPFGIAVMLIAWMWLASRLSAAHSPQPSRGER